MEKGTHTKEVFLHIGFHKTGSTFLQSKIFPNLEGVTFFNRNLDLNRLFKTEDKLLLSNVGMSGCPYLVGEGDFFDQFRVSIKYLQKIFKDPKIIICFREPGKYINSCYKQHLHEGGQLKFEEFISLDGNSKINYENFFFKKFVEYLRDNVQNQNIFIYDFESFIKYPEIVVNSMSKFITGGIYKKDIINKKSNSAVPLALESTLRNANIYFGNKNFKIFGKLINNRTVIQTLIPRLIKFSKKRDVSGLQEFFKEDYLEAKKIIFEMNPELYRSITK